MNKIRVLISIVIIIAIGFAQTSCIGSFKLFNKVLNWNKKVSGKFVNELVYLLFWIVPVYEISLLIDGLVLNTLEFWTGSNPVAMNAGEKETKIVEQNGLKYQVTASQNRFDFTQLEGPQKGQSGALVYNSSSQTWSYEGENLSINLLKYNGDGTVTAYFPNGISKTIETNQNGFASLKSFASSTYFMAEK